MQRTWRRGLKAGALVLVLFGAAVGVLVQSMAGRNGGSGSMAGAAELYYSVLGALFWIPAYVAGLAVMSAVARIARRATTAD